ncbi:MAG: DapH/DapD/GlmU-related protein [Candidatus Bathyarchaeia archaeon]
MKAPASSRIDVTALISGNFRLGRKATISAYVRIRGPVTIGSQSFIGENSSLGFPTRTELRGNSSQSRGRVKLGSNVCVRTNCVIYPSVSIGNFTELGHNVTLREEISIGTRSLIGTNTIVDGYCKIGSRVSIQSGVYIPMRSLVEDDAFLGPHCVLTNDKFMKKGARLIGPTIKRRARIGANAVIFPGVTIGEEATVGAGAVVRQNIPSRSVVAGVPAQAISENRVR